jgi:hypothetical protein
MCVVTASSRVEPSEASSSHRPCSSADVVGGLHRGGALRVGGGLRRRRGDAFRVRVGRGELAGRSAAPHARPRGRDREQREHRVADRPADRLQPPARVRLDQRRIAEQRDHRGEVRQRVEPVDARRAVLPREPGLHQRAGGREHQVGQADRQRQQQQDPADRLRRVGRLHRLGHGDRQEREAREQQHRVHDRLTARRELADHDVGVEVAGQQRELEEHHAGGPDRGRAAEPRQDLAGDDRLDQEQQERGQRDRGGVQEHGRVGFGSVYRA